MTKHYHVNYNPNKSQEVAAGLRKLREIITTTEHSEARIWVPVKDNVSHIFAGVLSQKQIQDLTDGSVTLDGTTCHLTTPKIQPSLRGPILAIHCDDFAWPLLTGDEKASHIIFVPWMETELQNYLKAHPDSELAS